MPRQRGDTAGLIISTPATRNRVFTACLYIAPARCRPVERLSMARTCPSSFSASSGVSKPRSPPGSPRAFHRSGSCPCRLIRRKLRRGLPDIPRGGRTGRRGNACPRVHPAPAHCGAGQAGGGRPSPVRSMKPAPPAGGTKPHAGAPGGRGRKPQPQASGGGRMTLPGQPCSSRENCLRFMAPQESLPLRYLRNPMKRMMVLNCRKPKLSSSANPASVST